MLLVPRRLSSFVLEIAEAFQDGAANDG